MKRSRDYKRLASQKMFTKFGKLAGATAVYGGIYVAVAMAAFIAYTLNLITKGVFASMASMEMYMDEVMNSPVYYFVPQLVMILLGALMSTLSVSVQYMCLKTARGEKIALSDILFVVKNNPDKVIIIYVIQELLMFLFSMPANLVSLFLDVEGNTTMQIVSWVLVIFGYIADIVIITMFSQAMFLYIDNPEESAIKCVEMSMHVMKRHMGRYILLVISFIPVSILACLSFGLFYLWVLPYKYTTYALFYMQLKGELGSQIDVTIQ